MTKDQIIAEVKARIAMPEAKEQREPPRPHIFPVAYRKKDCAPCPKIVVR